MAAPRVNEIAPRVLKGSQRVKKKKKIVIF